MLDARTACGMFLQSRDTYCSDITVKNYSHTIGYFLSFLSDTRSARPEDIDVRSVTLADLNAYSVFLKNKYKNDGNAYIATSSEKISARTRKDYLKDMKCFMNYLYENGCIDVNPSDRMRLPRAHASVIEPLTVAEVSEIDACYNADTKVGCRNLCLIHLLLDEGMRSGEVQRLKVRDVNFAENYIVIRNSKGGKSRIVPLAGIPGRYMHRLFQLDAPADDGYVLHSVSGDPLSPDAVKGIFARLRPKCGIPRLKPHLLRHTFATSFILGGGSVEILRIYMGHSSIETTQNYMHVADSMRFLENIYPVDPCFRKKFY